MNERINVLYIDGVGPFGGSSRSLYELISNFEKNSVSAYFVAAKGTSLNFYKNISSEIIETKGLFRFDNTEYSRYRGIRWIVLLREISHIPHTIVAAIRTWLRFGKKIDLIHCNEITEIFSAILIKLILKKPLIVHVRSAQWKNHHALRSRIINFALKKYADQVISIDQTVKATLFRDIECTVIHNSFTAQKNVSVATNEELGIRSISKMRIGFVGNLQTSKGTLDLIKAAKLVQEKIGDKVEFVFVGGATYNHHKLKKRMLKFFGLAQESATEMHRLVDELGLSSIVHLIGHRTDIHRIYPTFDVLAFPSHFDAPGRPVFEAAFYGVPSIVCVDNPLPDTIQPWRTGLCVPAKNPTALAKAIFWYFENPERRKEMGRACQELADDNFSPAGNATRMLNIYRKIYRISQRL